MRIIETIVKTFNEWDEDTQSKIIDNNREFNVDYDWWQSCYEDAKMIGLKITSFDLDRRKHCTGEFTEQHYNVAKNIMSEHGESCNTYKIAKYFKDEYDRLTIIAHDSDEDTQYKMTEEFDNLEADFLNDVLNEYSNILQKEYEYLMSDECIRETLICNQYEFDCNGKMY